MNTDKFSSSLGKMLAVVFCLLFCLSFSHAQTGGPGKPAGKAKDPTTLELLNRVLAKSKRSDRFVRMDDMLLLRSSVVQLRDSLIKKSGDFSTNIAFGFKVPLWTGGRVAYQYAPDCPAENKPLFEAAAKEWAKYANLTFVPRTNETNYITIFRDPTAIGFSYSALGMVGGEQPLSISEGANIFLVAHEIGHALGCEHEHQRSDRAKYLTINYDNIDADSQSQFTIVSDSDNQTSYDFDSIMHYFSTAFAIDPSIPTMICKPGFEQFQDKMGQQDHLSTLDKIGMEKKYPFATASTFAISDPVIAEGDDGTSFVKFTITLASGKDKGASVKYATLRGTAVPGVDFKVAAGILEFKAGQTSKTISVGIIGDKEVEANEQFTLALSDPNGAKLTDKAGTATILDDDSTPTLSVAKTTVTEGDKAGVSANIALTLSSPTGLPVSVTYSTKNGTALAGSDYTAADKKTITFEPRETTKTISIPLTGDRTYEKKEDFSLILSGAKNATLGVKPVVATTVTVTDNDPLPKITATGTTVAENQAGTTPIKFTIRLTNPSSFLIKLKYGTTPAPNYPATAGLDFDAVPGTQVTFEPGETIKTVLANIKDDALDEDDEAVALKLSNPFGATISTSLAIGTIKDDDIMPTLSVNDVSVREGNSGITKLPFVIKLSAPSGRSVTVAYTTMDRTALAASDYAAITKNSVTFVPGQVSKTVNVAVSGDVAFESDETLALQLSDALHARIRDDVSLGTILNDDSISPTLSVSSPSITEGDASFKLLSFTFKLSRSSESPITVTYATMSGSAKEDLDFTLLAPTILTFAPGETKKTINVRVLGDTAKESTEKFRLVLTDPSNVIISEDGGEGIIFDNDSETTAAATSAKPVVSPSAPAS